METESIGQRNNTLLNFLKISQLARERNTTIASSRLSFICQRQAAKPPRIGQKINARGCLSAGLPGIAPAFPRIKAHFSVFYDTGILLITFSSSVIPSEAVFKLQPKTPEKYQSWCLKQRFARRHTALLVYCQLRRETRPDTRQNCNTIHHALVGWGIDKFTHVRQCIINAHKCKCTLATNRNNLFRMSPLSNITLMYIIYCKV